MKDNIFQKLCGLITKHKYRELEGIREVDPVEYYYRCKICRKSFWNYVLFRRK